MFIPTPRRADEQGMSNLVCPKCGKPIPAEDVNVGQGVALCRGCSTVTRLADLASDPVLDQADPGATPPGCQFRDDGVETVVTASARTVGGAIGALFICLFWNGIVSVFVLIAAASTLQHLLGRVPAWFPAPPMSGKNAAGIPLGMTLFLWIFLTPFIAVGLAVLGAFLTCVAGRVEVRIRDGVGVVFIGFGPVGWRRRFEVAQVRSVSIGRTTWSQNNQTKPVIVIDCGEPLRFGSGLPEIRRDWMGATLRKMLVSHSMPRPFSMG
jgi:hypothetical protein